MRGQAPCGHRCSVWGKRVCSISYITCFMEMAEFAGSCARFSSGNSGLYASCSTPHSAEQQCPAPRSGESHCHYVPKFFLQAQEGYCNHLK